MKNRALLICVFASIQLAAMAVEREEVKDDLKDLSVLRYVAYCEKRKVLMEKYTEKDLKDVVGALANPILRIVAHSMSMEKQHPELPNILSVAWAEKGGFGGVKQVPPRALRQFGRYARIVVLCMGADILAPLAERIWFFGDGNQTYGDMDALLETRNSEAIDILLRALDGPEQPDEFRANILWRLEKCLNGVDALNLHVADTDTGLGPGPAIPDVLRKFAGDRNLPEMRLSENTKDAVFRAAAKHLKLARDAQVKVLAIHLLCHFGDKAIESVSAAMVNDQSTWVRASCVVALQSIGGDAAARALKSAKDSENDSDVRKVFAGHAKPFPPRRGVPSDSILQKEKE